MNRFRIWGLSVAAAVGGGGALFAAPPGSPQSNLVSAFFGPKEKKPGEAGEQPQTITVVEPLSPEAVQDALQAEQGAYLRRLSVCTELRRIATERGDTALARQADELERQCTELYNARVTAIGVPADVKAPLPTLVSLEEPSSLDPAMKARRLEAPTAPVPGTVTAGVREVTP